MQIEIKNVDREIVRSVEFKKFKIFHIYPNISDWVLTADENNPRSHDTDVKSAKTIISKISETLDANEDLFPVANRGMKIVTDNCEYNPETKIIKFSILDRKIHGTVDGGTTQKAILEYIAKKTYK